MSDNQNTTMSQAQFDVSIMREYIRFMHIVIAIMLIAIMGMGAGFVYKGYQERALIEKMIEMTRHIDAITLENDHLRETNKPLQEKIKKGGAYIERYGVPQDIAVTYSRKIMLEAMRHGLDFALALAIPSVESSFNPNAISYTDCCLGLYQVHLRIWSQEKPGLTRDDLFNPYRNIEVGQEILKEYQVKAGSIPKALERYYGSTVPDENVAYAQKVLNRSRQIAAFLNG